jgi:hypothetical protein
MGTVSSTADSAQIRLLTDDNRLPSASNRVKLRLVNGVASAPPVTLSIDFSALAIDVPAGTASTYATLNFNSSVRVDVTAAGAASELYTTSDVNLQAQSVYSVYLLDGNAAATGVIRKER